MEFASAIRRPHPCPQSASASAVRNLQIPPCHNDLENIHQWLLANKLTLNTSKTEYMMVGSRQKLGKGEDDTHIKLEDNKIKKVKEANTLAVIVDDQLK